MNLVDPRRYQNILFDCDGVLLDSNKVKTAAFFQVAKTYGDKAARKLIQHHLENGGVSRYLKFKYLLTEIVGIEATENKIEQLLDKFSEEVEKGLAACETVPNLKILRDVCNRSGWAVISGGEQKELRRKLQTLSLTNLFDMGIYGSPHTKEEIVEKYLQPKIANSPTLYIGDSRYDYEIAARYGFDFLFVKDWSEWASWRDYHSGYKFSVVDNLENWINVFKE